MKWKFWEPSEQVLRTRADISFEAYKIAQNEHAELGECIKKLRAYQETLCPYVSRNTYSYDISYHNPELHTAIEDRIKKIVQLQTEILL